MARMDGQPRKPMPRFRGMMAATPFRHCRHVAALVVAFMILLHTCAQAQTVSTPDSAGAPTKPGIVISAVLGSAGGMVGGAALGNLLSDRFGFDRGGEDPGLASTVLGGLVGSMAGTVFGAHLASRAHGQRVPFARRMRDLLGATLLGCGVAWGVGRLTHDAEPAIVAFSLAQGLYAGLSNGQW
jgi:hypothetical protein